ncbi:MAG: hypothetical protein LBQ24_04015 [Candidatus Peribacteria bacterium]|nr:hypothetical protein [Candidatus Peribacteria bacterium]
MSDEKEILKFKLDKTSKHQTYILEVIFEDKKFGNKDKALAFIKDLFKNNSYKFSYELEEKNEFNWLYFLL